MAHVGQEIALGLTGGLRRLLGPFQGQRRLPSAGHVRGHGQVAGDLALIVADGGDGEVDRQAAAVLASIGPLALLGLAAPRLLGESAEPFDGDAELLGSRPGIGRSLRRDAEQLRGGRADNLFRLVAEHAFGAAVEQGDGAGGIGGDDGDLRGRIQDRLEMAVALGQHLGRLLDLTEIVYVGGQQGRLLGMQYGHRQFDGEFAPFRVPADGFDSSLKQRPLAAGLEGGHAPPVGFAQRGRNDRLLDGRAQDGFTLIAKQPLGGGVEFDDAAQLIDGDDAVQGVVDDGPRPGLALLHLLGETGQLPDLLLLQGQHRFQFAGPILHWSLRLSVLALGDQPGEQER